MNKKASLIHWTLFGILAAAGMFAVLQADIDTGQHVKGGWAMGFYDGVLEAERELIILEQDARVAATQVSKKIGAVALASDLGCGQYKGFALLNSKKNFCNIDLSEFNEQFKNKIKPLGDYEIKSENGYVAGKSLKNKEVKTNPTSIIWLSTDQSRMLIRQFKFTYFYAPSFRIPLGGFASDFKEIKQQAQVLVNSCRDVKDLKSCLNSQLLEWKFGRCGNENYGEINRVLTFCSEPYTFALDFAPSKPFPILGLKLSGNTVSFKQDSMANSYNIHYTDHTTPISKKGKVNDVFNPNPILLNKVYTVLPITSPQPCNPTPALDVAYLCQDTISYAVSLPTADKFYFTVTAVADGEDGEESDIIGFVS